MKTIKINNIEWDEIIMSKNIQIKNRYTDEVIFECEGSIKEAVEKAVREKANLREADLIRADLSGADLWGADLSGANLIRADLNAIFYKTKITLKQRKYIAEESDLFSVVGDSSSFSEKELRK